MEIPFHIKRILEERKITDLLDSRGIVCHRQNGNRYMYKCPLHEGDNDPSFIVYTGEEFENYFCYGCNNGGNVINLLCSLDDVSLKQSVKELIKGIDIDETQVLKSLVKALMEGSFVDDRNLIEVMGLKFSRSCRNHFEETNYNSKEIAFFEKRFKKIDNLSIVRDIESLNKIYDFIMSKGLVIRKNKYLKEQEDILLGRDDTWSKIK
jgi:DNA primase